MVLGLIGMSGIGKTTWAKRFTEAGFTCIHCDDLIAERLRLDGVADVTTVDDLGSWMGFPWSATYHELEARYLRYEAEILREIAASIEHHDAHSQPVVIDMTGSVIYVDEQTQAAIERVATIVYLATSPAQQAELLRAYQAKPRPIIWNGHYMPLPHESPEDTLARCYPNLIEARSVIYAAFANVTLEAAVHGDGSLSVAQFLQLAVR